MGNASCNGAIVPGAPLPIVPLATYLRRRSGGKRPRALGAAGAASLAPLVAGAGLANGSGTL